MKWMFSLFVVISFFTTCKDCKNKVVSYTIEEPYTETEMTNVELTSEIVPNSMRYERNGGLLVLGENPKISMIAVIKNTSETDGTFEFSARVSSQGDIIDFKKSVFVSALSTAEVRIEKEINPFSFKTNLELVDYSIENPTVVKEKEVTKFRTVVKTRECNTCDKNCD